jgi:2-hydroxy-3-oxopropionate reductase
MTASPATTPVGFIGLGIMGESMARNILKAGFALTVYDIAPQKVEALAKAGARAAASPADVAKASDVIVTSVPDTPDMEKVLFGADGIAGTARKGAVVIDCSTISATATREFAERLGRQGVALLDSPVSGGAKGAADGTLSCMIGGDAAVIEGCMPIFQAIGKTFVHIGPVGAGQIAKSCNQLVISATLLGVSEAIALCRKTGIDPAKVRDALLGGAARSFVLEAHGKNIIAETVEPGFRAALMLKDMKVATMVGRDSGTFMPATALATQMLTALCETGRAGKDTAALGLLFQELSGVRKT